MVDLVNKSKRIGGFAYSYLPILVNISDNMHHQASAKSILLNPPIALQQL